tara:strand:- start:184 stop:1032 length:849 start_codon:yes stop_codon:yes gene_type:complete
MKVFSSLCSIVLIFSCLSIYAQNVNEIDEKDDKPSYEAHWAGMDIGSTILFNADFGTDFSDGTWLDNPWWENDIANSTTFSFNMFEYKLPIFKQYLGLTTGFGYRNTNIEFRKNYQLDYNNQNVFAYEINPSAAEEEISEIKRNYLSAHYFTVPLLLEFATKVKGKKSFYFNVGIVGGVRFASSTTLKGRYDNGDKFNNVRRAKYNLNPIFLDASFRIGYGAFGLFGTYSLTTMFKTGSYTLAVHPLRVGITWNWNYAGLNNGDKNKFDFETFEEADEDIDL